MGWAAVEKYSKGKKIICVFIIIFILWLLEMH